MRKSIFWAAGISVVGFSFFQLSANENNSTGEPVSPPDENPPDEEVVFEDPSGTTQISLRLTAGNGAYTSGGTTVLVDGVNPRDKPGAQGSIHYSIAAAPVEANTFYISGDRQDTPLQNFIGASAYSGNLWRGDTSVTRGHQQSVVATGTPDPPE